MGRLTLIAFFLVVVGAALGIYRMAMHAAPAGDPLVLFIERVGLLETVLVQESFVEVIPVGEDPPGLLNDWQAEVIAAYEFKYGLRPAALAITPLPPAPDGTRRIDVTVNELVVVAASVRAVRAYLKSTSWFDEAEAGMARSRDALFLRATRLAQARVIGDDAGLRALLEQMLRTHLQDTATLLGLKLEVASVTLPPPDPARARALLADARLPVQQGAAGSLLGALVEAGNSRAFRLGEVPVTLRAP